MCHVETIRSNDKPNRQMSELPVATVSRLIKPQDLNHHGTLFAGRMAEWAVETAFIGAQKVLAVDPREVVCIRMHGLTFSRPVRNGTVIDIRAQTAHVGKSSLTIYIETLTSDNGVTPLLDGYITFVHVNQEGRACPHGLAVEKPASGVSLALWEHVEGLKAQGH